MSESKAWLVEKLKKPQIYVVTFNPQNLEHRIFMLIDSEGFVYFLEEIKVTGE